MALELVSVSDAGEWPAWRGSSGLPESHLALIEPVKVADLLERAGSGRTPVVAEHSVISNRFVD